jgi:hypothetical protein
MKATPRPIQVENGRQGPAAGVGHLAGCFGSTACQTINENGAPADLRGPGAVSLPVTLTVHH